MHPALRTILNDLRALTHSAKVTYLTNLRAALAIHGALSVPYKGALVPIDAPQWEHFFTKAGA